jgi:hypothetical protein
VRDVLEHGKREAAADDRRDLGSAARARRQPIDPREQEALQRWRQDPRSGDRRGPRLAASEPAAGCERPEELLEVERVALRALHDLLELALAERLAARHRRQELPGGLVVERLQREVVGAVRELRQDAHAKLPAF